MFIQQGGDFVGCHPSLLPHPVAADEGPGHRRQCVLQTNEQYTAPCVTAP